MEGNSLSCCFLLFSLRRYTTTALCLAGQLIESKAKVSSTPGDENGLVTVCVMQLSESRGTQRSARNILRVMSTILVNVDEQNSEQASSQLRRNFRKTAGPTESFWMSEKRREKRSLLDNYGKCAITPSERDWQLKLRMVWHACMVEAGPG